MSDPEVTVVIATRDRETRLAFALEALAAQTIARDRFEVVVVRHPDSPPGRAQAPEALQVRFLTAGGAPGPTGQRNAGWRAGSAPLVAFTDDDCRVEPDWLEHLLGAAATQPGAILQGETRPDPDELHLLHGLARTRSVAAHSEFFEACNIAYPRELLERIDGFDEAFVFGGEDTDLGLRAVAAGAERAPVPAARVHHAVLAVPLRQALLQRDARSSEPLVVARHPRHRRHLFAGLFTRDSHAWALLGLAGLGAAAWGVGGRRLPWIAALLPWVGHRADTRGGPRGLLRSLLHLPLRGAVDLAETLAAIRAAIRHRVFVL